MWHNDCAMMILYDHPVFFNIPIQDQKGSSFDQEIRELGNSQNPRHFLGFVVILLHMHQVANQLAIAAVFN